MKTHNWAPFRKTEMLWITSVTFLIPSKKQCIISALHLFITLIVATVQVALPDESYAKYLSWSKYKPRRLDYIKSEDQAMHPHWAYGPASLSVHRSVLCTSGIAEGGEYARDLTKFYCTGKIRHKCLMTCPLFHQSRSHFLNWVIFQKINGESTVHTENRMLILPNAGHPFGLEAN